MENNTRTNKLAIISFICGLIALISIGIIFGAYNLTEPTQAILFITDGILMPIRNISVVAALITGIFALRDLKKKDHSEKGKWLAWAGIIMGGAWIIFGVFVGLLFSVSSFAQLW
jgi:hypothetical protein